jgi:hypothetical protein
MGGVPGLITKTLLCVDGTTAEDIYGRFYNLYIEDPVSFAGIKEFLDKMGDFFDTISFPQNFFDFRYFRENNKGMPARRAAPEWKKYQSDVLFDVEKGERATFIFQVQYRQKAEWQGILTWVEQKKMMPFRSTLEFIRLLDVALKDGEGTSAGWGGTDAEAL